jgi:predicted nucleotidyltransferase
MDYLYTVRLIKDFLLKRELEIYKFFLFGSRARKDNAPDSDYDFMVVLKSNISDKERRIISGELRSFLIKQNAILNMDLIIKNLDNWNWESQNIGFLSYTVKSEGVSI